MEARQRLEIRDPVVVKRPASFPGGIEKLVSPIQKLVNSVDVTHLDVLLTQNTSAVTITSFTGGSEGQEIKILGDGFTTIANNSSIKTNTGANKLLQALKIYTFTLCLGVWYENA